MTRGDRELLPIAVFSRCNSERIVIAAGCRSSNSSNKVNFRNVGLTFPRTKACIGGRSCATPEEEKTPAGNERRMDETGRKEAGLKNRATFRENRPSYSFVRCFCSRLEAVSSSEFPKGRLNMKLIVVLVNTCVFFLRKHENILVP